MPITLSDVDSFDDVTAPAGSDVRNAASIQTSMQTVANRTRNLKNRADGHDASIANEAAARDAADATTAPGLRLSLASLVPVHGSDVAGGSTLYYTPYESGRIGLYYGGAWQLFTLSAEISLALSGLTSGKNYDVFAYYTGSAVALELSAAWTNDTTRADALTTLDGVVVKSSNTTRRHIGTIRASGATTTEDTVTKRFVWNRYHRVAQQMKVTESAGSWTYATASWRQANANAANKVEFVCGDVVEIEARAQVMCNHSATGQVIAAGVGVDSTTANSATTHGVTSQTAGVGSQNTSAHYAGRVAAGYHYLAWLEYTASATMTCFSNTTGYKSGLVASIRG